MLRRNPSPAPGSLPCQDACAKILAGRMADGHGRCSTRSGMRTSSPISARAGRCCISTASCCTTCPARRALAEVAERGHALARPELVFATPDHAVSTAPGRTSETFAGGARPWPGCAAGAARPASGCIDLGQPGNGIVHVMAPELAIVLPGMTLVCGDSHTCTNGGVGALAFGIGASELSACAGDADADAAPAAHHARSASRAACRPASRRRT